MLAERLCFHQWLFFAPAMMELVESDQKGRAELHFDTWAFQALNYCNRRRVPGTRSGLAVAALVNRPGLQRRADLLSTLSVPPLPLLRHLQRIVVSATEHLWPGLAFCTACLSSLESSSLFQILRMIRSSLSP